MCLQDQGLDDNNGSVGRVRRAHKLRKNNRVAGRGRGIHNASEGSEITTGVVGARRGYRGPKDASAEEDKHKEYNKKMEASEEGRRRVQWIGDDDKGRSGLTTGLVN